MKKLLVIVPDRISQILQKGEYQPDYYNPGRLFDEVHILMTNDDRPDANQLQRTVGNARLFVHNHPETSELIVRRWSWFGHRGLRVWADRGVEIARRIRPELIRCHGADWNAYLASRIKRTLGIPYVVSLHINPDVNPPRRFVHSQLDDSERRHNQFFEYLEREGLRNADLVMPVYQPIVPYLRRMGVTRFQVCYNILNRGFLTPKADYRLGSPVRIVCVGRLFDKKDPTNIIRAVAQIPGVELTVIGDGPKRHDLEALVRHLGATDQILFEPAVPNDDLCRRLPRYDIFAVHTEYWEINKSVLEALLTGLPVIVNRRNGPPVPELEGDFVLKVENTVEGYRSAIQRLIADHDFRASLGRLAQCHARERWSPERTEAEVVTVYQNVVNGKAHNASTH